MKEKPVLELCVSVRGVSMWPLVALTLWEERWSTDLPQPCLFPFRLTCDSQLLFQLMILDSTDKTHVCHPLCCRGVLGVHGMGPWPCSYLSLYVGAARSLSSGGGLLDRPTEHE